jgi:hypothetical protein
MTLTGGAHRDEFLGPTWSDDDVAALMCRLELDWPMAPVDCYSGS